MATKNVQQPANGTRSATDTVLLVQQMDGSGSVVGTSTTANPPTASAVVTQDASGIDVTTSSTDLLAANTTRKGLLLVNTGTAGVTVTLGATAVAKTGLWLGPNGGSWDGLIGNALWTGSVKAISDSGTNTVTVVEV